MDWRGRDGEGEFILDVFFYLEMALLIFFESPTIGLLLFFIFFILHLLIDFY